MFKLSNKQIEEILKRNLEGLNSKFDEEINEIKEERNFYSNFIGNQLYMLPDELDKAKPLGFRNLPVIPNLMLPISLEKPIKMINISPIKPFCETPKREGSSSFIEELKKSGPGNLRKSFEEIGPNLHVFTPQDESKFIEKIHIELALFQKQTIKRGHSFSDLKPYFMPKPLPKPKFISKVAPNALFEKLAKKVGVKIEEKLFDPKERIYEHLSKMLPGYRKLLNIPYK